MKADSEIQALSEERYAAYRQREDLRRSKRRPAVKERDLMAHAIDEGRYEEYRTDVDGKLISLHC